MDNDTALAPVVAQTNEVATLGADNLLMNTKSLAMINRLADRYANSGMVPQTYQGKPDNCFVALELAARMNVSPILVMQNLYIVQGKPSWAGQACKALIDGSGRFEQSEYVFVGEPGKPSYGCFLQAKSKATGRMVKSTTVTLQMAQDEGWSTKAGSKWKTMPEQMLKYRAAAFFARTECPEALMGFQTAEEVQDIAPEEKPKTKITMERVDA